MNIFTHSESTIPKYKVLQAIEQAKMVIRHNYRKDCLCMNKVQHLSADRSLTLKELSDLVEELVYDTLFWEI